MTIAPGYLVGTKNVASGTRVGAFIPLDLSAPSKRDETALATASFQLWQRENVSCAPSWRTQHGSQQGGNQYVNPQ